MNPPFHILILWFLFTGCSDCKVDIRLKNKLENHIETIVLRYKQVTGKSKTGISGEEMGKSIYYLNLLTGYESYHAFNYANSYINTSILKDDIKQWWLWYEKNKCGLTLEEADKIVESKSQY